MKFPISAIVVGFNEGHLLESCLRSLDFCDEIIYTDLGSTDSSLKIADHFSTKVFQRHIAPSGEYVQSEIVNLTQNKWVLFIDPDERIDPALASQIVAVFCNIMNSEFVGAVLVPWQFYFKKRRLAGTVWGLGNMKYLLAHKDKFDFLPITHYGRKIKQNYSTHEIKLSQSNDNVLHHYWMQGYTKLFEKHLRYLKNEGEALNQLGYRTSLKKIIQEPWRQFIFSFITKKGYADGLTGLFLSLFWAWYQTSALIRLFKIQNQNIA